MWIEETHELEGTPSEMMRLGILRVVAGGSE